MMHVILWNGLKLVSQCYICATASLKDNREKFIILSLFNAVFWTDALWTIRSIQRY